MSRKRGLLQAKIAVLTQKARILYCLVTKFKVTNSRFCPLSAPNTNKTNKTPHTSYFMYLKGIEYHFMKIYQYINRHIWTKSDKTSFSVLGLLGRLNYLGYTSKISESWHMGRTIDL